ncbi:hypothetical protein KL938_005397 [Ogataea parapolymorpha]|nr:hypothetical protein KL938_005397 [Ogataea parapolymorpha]
MSADPDNSLGLTTSPIRNSLPLISERLEKYRQLVVFMEAYIHDHLSIVTTNIKSHERLRKSTSIDSVVRFETDPEGSMPVTETSGIEHAGSHDHDINTFFRLLQDQTESLIKQMGLAETTMKSQVIPQLKGLQSSISTKQKEFSHLCHKHEKEYKLALQQTTKELEHFELSITKSEMLPENAKLDFRHDPYFNKRILMSQADAQLQSEQKFLNFIQNSETDLRLAEIQTTQELKHIFELFSSTLVHLHGDYSKSFQMLNTHFQDIPNDLEWSRFLKVYDNKLASTSETLHDLSHPSSNRNHIPEPHARNLETVTFPNRQHFSTVPILEGVLARKDGKLTSKMSSHYYVITKNRFFFEFNSRVCSNTQPNHVFFLPECTVKDLVDSGPYRFKLHGKDLSSAFIKSSKTLVLEASSEDELKTWYNVLSELTGLMYSSQESRDSD